MTKQEMDKQEDKQEVPYPFDDKWTAETIEEVLSERTARGHEVTDEESLKGALELLRTMTISEAALDSFYNDEISFEYNNGELYFVSNLGKWKKPDTVTVIDCGEIDDGGKEKQHDKRYTG